MSAAMSAMLRARGLDLTVRDLIKSAQALEAALTEIGCDQEFVCDHSVGICFCEVIRARRDLRIAVNRAMEVIA